MSILTREEILNSKDCEIVEVDCNEWGGNVKVKPLTLRERYDIISGSKTNASESDVNKFLVLTLIHGVVEPKFTNADYEALQDKNHAPIDRIVNKIWELSGLSSRGELKNASGATANIGIS